MSPEQRGFDSEAFERESAKLRQNRGDLLNRFDGYLGERLEHKGEEALTANFLIDGTAVIERDEFMELPDFLKGFLLDGRVSLPVSVTAFNDYKENDGAVGSLKGLGESVALKGSRYYDFDGSKANHGPDESYALELLGENLHQDLRVIDQLLDFEPKTRSEWLASLAAWEYVRNDLSAAYFLKKCQRVLDPREGDDEMVEKYDQVLEWVSDRYFDSILMMDTGEDNVEANKRLISEVIDDLITQEYLVSESEFIDRDLIRCHREVANPFSLMYGIYAVYDVSKTESGFVPLRERIKEADAILTPLYGGVDFAMSVRYVLKNGKQIVSEIGGLEAEQLEDLPPVESVLSKIGSRGVVRSSITEDTNPMNALPTDLKVEEPKGSDLETVLESAEKVVIIDDSMATGGSMDIFVDWLEKVAGHELQVTPMAAFANYPWAHLQGISIEKLATVNPLGVSPVVRNFGGALYQRWSRFMPDRLTSEMALRTNRTALSLGEVGEMIDDLLKYDVIDGVGFDVDDTLIVRTMSGKERRKEISRRETDLLNQNGVKVDLDEYSKLSYEILNRDRKEAHKDPNYPIDMHSINRNILYEISRKKNIAFEGDKLESLASQMVEVELNLDLEIVEANEGAEKMLKTLSQMDSLGVAMYSNTHYTRNQMWQLLEKAGLGEYVSKDLLFVSSAPGYSLKPAKDSVVSLSQQMGVGSRHLLFVGNSNSSDVTAAAKAGAIPLHYLYPGEYPKRENEQVKWRNFLKTARESIGSKVYA